MESGFRRALAGGQVRPRWTRFAFARAHLPVRVAWYTPFHVQSGIGRRAAIVGAELAAKGCEVTIVRSEDGALGETASWPTALPVVHARDFEPDVAHAHQRFDVVLYAIGNHYLNHRYAVEHALSRPGVVILCDRVLNGFVWQERGGLAGLLDAVADEAGEVAASELRASWARGEILADIVYRQPIWRFAVRNATAIVVHSLTHQAEVRAAVCVPVLALPLAAPPRPAPSARPDAHRGEELRLITFGFIAPNKRCIDVIRAIGAEPRLRERCIYVVAGTAGDPSYEASLHDTAQELGVRLERRAGYLAERELLALVDAADIVLCLRDPLTESGSGTLLDALQRGRPTIVLSHGVFGELPDTAARKVPPGDVVDGVRSALLELAASPQRRRDLGKAAAAFAARHYSGARYAKGLLQLFATLREQSR